jgi:hypothetical protein|tara:strand:+ start:507 stop:818 length:312 start_codon:yes stop_codon:yes gene_type:complete
MSEEKAATGGDTNYLLVYGGKINGMRESEDGFGHEGNTDRSELQRNYYVFDDGKWELLEMDSDALKGIQDYMTTRDQNMALLWVPHQAITINENDEVVSIDLP